MIFKNDFSKKLALKVLILTVSLSLSTFATARASDSESEAELVFLQRDSYVTLSASYYAGNEKGAGVLLLHDCSHDSKSYQKLGTKLAEQGIHALALDFRGFGESVSKAYSNKAIKEQTNDMISYQAEFSKLNRHWYQDLLGAHAYLRDKIGKTNKIAIVASGCSAVQAIRLAEKVRIDSLVMLAPIMNDSEKERYKNLFDIPTYFISSIHHSESFNTAQELFLWNGDNATTAKIFKGTRQGHSLLQGKRTLANDISLWIANSFN